MSFIVELSGVNKVFHTEEIETHALNDISFAIEKGEYVSISGPSGCGKSTLLSILGLLDSPSGGKYVINGFEVGSLNPRRMAEIRNQEIGFVFQSFNLISDLTVEENVMLPLTYRKGIAAKEMQAAALAALEKVDMQHRSKHFPSQLSGGQQQRVAIARAIVGQPSLLLADEPTGNLDSKNAEAVMNLFDQLHSDGVTICIVTHDPRSAAHALRQIDIFDGMVIDDRHLDSQGLVA
ncbi:ABC transporter ATP-binding protein [Vibrio mangrovi]|uniref:ABC transporter ATP-binding protein n=1 Tax=Vibrio mangrovi TaxID=474394 RepID=A0A1Y6ISC0_9VIBR|nr:ABC transporter ATP-binding protein [Vibrio mangrovi]MDW6001409.1 ABC transporter ATP-binding protein [Vibrio mangrovi]SMS00569.1 Macrolide export ATP-binding/permease protein MacB [Vibrio mangrovi]